MPGVLMLNRRWNFASDDLFYPSLFEIIFRSLWASSQVILYIIHKDKFQCAELNLLKVYFIGVLCTLLSVLFIQCIILYISTRGTITNTRPRRHMNIFIYLRVILVLFELIWCIIGIKWLIDVKSPFNCSNFVYFVVLLNIIFCFIAIVLLLIGIITIIDPISHLSYDEVALRRTRIISHIRALCCCCCMFTGGSNSSDQNYENTYKQISSILELIFRGGDLTPTDITAGLLLLSKKEMHQHDREFKLYTSLKYSNFNINNPNYWMNVNEASYFIRYALAIYSWPYYIYMNPIRGFCNLCFSSKCFCFCCCCAKKTQINSNIRSIDGDNKCKCYYDAFKRLAKLHDCDVIYVNFKNELFQTPFFISIDHYKKVVIISIRGTLSMRDIITDITADCGYIDANDDLKNEKCHIGILNTAQNIYIKIKNDNLLEKAFKYNQNYELLITGHSLGAGAAAILAIKLRSEYPNLRCICYSPPGGLLSEKLADYTKLFVLTVIIGDDIVARLSIRSVHNLKAKILNELHATNSPKYKILWNSSKKFICDCIKLNNGTSNDQLIEGDANNDLLDSSILTTNTEVRESDNSSTTRTTASVTAVAQNQVIDIIEEHNETINKIEDDNTCRVHKQVENLLKVAYETYDEFQLPGQILYIYRIRENKNTRRCCGSFRNMDSYDLRWADRNEFKNILITKHMLIDHFPNRVEDALRFFYQYSDAYV